MQARLWMLPTNHVAELVHKIAALQKLEALRALEDSYEADWSRLSGIRREAAMLDESAESLPESNTGDAADAWLGMSVASGRGARDVTINRRSVAFARRSSYQGLSGQTRATGFPGTDWWGDDSDEDVSPPTNWRREQKRDSAGSEWPRESLAPQALRRGSLTPFQRRTGSPHERGSISPFKRRTGRAGSGSVLDGIKTRLTALRMSRPTRYAALDEADDLSPT